MECFDTSRSCSQTLLMNVLTACDLVVETVLAYVQLPTPIGESYSRGPKILVASDYHEYEVNINKSVAFCVKTVSNKFHKRLF